MTFSLKKIIQNFSSIANRTGNRFIFEGRAFQVYRRNKDIVMMYRFCCVAVELSDEGIAGRR